MIRASVLAAVAACGLSMGTQAESLPTGPNYSCYPVSASTGNFADGSTVVHFKDDFGQSEARLLKPRFACAYAEVRELAGPGLARADLLCYDVSDVRPTPRTVLVKNKFDEGKVEVRGLGMFCVASIITVPAATQ